MSFANLRNPPEINWFGVLGRTIKFDTRVEFHRRSLTDRGPARKIEGASESRSIYQVVTVAGKASRRGWSGAVCFL